MQYHIKALKVLLSSGEKFFTSLIFFWEIQESIQLKFFSGKTNEHRFPNTLLQISIFIFIYLTFSSYRKKQVVRYLLPLNDASVSNFLKLPTRFRKSSVYQAHKTGSFIYIYWSEFARRCANVKKHTTDGQNNTSLNIDNVRTSYYIKLWLN